MKTLKRSPKRFLLHERRSAHLLPRQDFTRYSASEAEELENLDGVGKVPSFCWVETLKHIETD